MGKDEKRRFANIASKHEGKAWINGMPDLKR
jgi:hypothetical protein